MDVKQFGKRIIFRREELDLSQKQLADIIHISNIHLSNIEHGKALPSFSTFFRFMCRSKCKCRLFNCRKCLSGIEC